MMCNIAPASGSVQPTEGDELPRVYTINALLRECSREGTEYMHSDEGGEGEAGLLAGFRNEGVLRAYMWCESWLQVLIDARNGENVVCSSAEL